MFCDNKENKHTSFFNVSCFYSLQKWTSVSLQSWSKRCLHRRGQELHIANANFAYQWRHFVTKLPITMTKSLYLPWLPYVTQYKQNLSKWKRINCKQIARWQHLSRLKDSAFLLEIFLISVKKYNNLYLRLVTPSSG